MADGRVLVGFYHLTAAPLEKVLPRICERILGEGGRLIVVAEESLAARLDELLWTYDPASFLPHGRTGNQPILIFASCEAANSAVNIALADGIWRDEALSSQRVFYLFDDAKLTKARAAWRMLKEREDVALTYWKQDERGKWVEGP